MLLNEENAPDLISIFPIRRYPSIPYAQHLLQITSVPLDSQPSQSDLQALLFESFRSPHFGRRYVYCFLMLFTAIDLLSNYSLNRLTLNPRTVLAMPLKLMVTTPEVGALRPAMVNFHPPPPKVCLQPTFQRMMGNHVAMWDPLNETWTLRVFTAEAITVFPRTTKNVINLIRQESLSFTPS